MSRATFIACCSFTLTASLWCISRPLAAEGDAAGKSDIRGFSCQDEIVAPNARPARGVGDDCNLFLMAAESDDVDAASHRLRQVGRTCPPSRVRSSTGALPPAWAHDADFFPNTLHVRLQI